MSADDQPATSREISQAVTVRQFFEAGKDRLELVIMAGKGGLDRVIGEPSAYRPGLALTGFYEYFANQRVQIIGRTEQAYLESLSVAERSDRFKRLCEKQIPCLVFAKNKTIFPEILELGDRYGIPVLISNMPTRHFIQAASYLLDNLAAPRCKLHGTMLEVSGLGVFIEGSAGVGKSETALGLVRRGHALVADDLVIFRRDYSGLLVGSAAEVTRHYMEIRGIGIIYMPTLFGIASARGEKQLDLVVTLLPQSEAGDNIDRSGEMDLRREILGVAIPQRIILVAPGRDLINIVEIAALEYKSRLSGQVAYQDLDERIKRHHVAIKE